jgi:hypothetical protein
VNAIPEPPSRFHASPAEIDAFLRQNFAEDVLLNFYRAAGDEILDEITTSGKQFRGLAETKGGKHVYLAGMDDVLTHIWDDRYYPAQLPKLATYDRPFGQRAGYQGHVHQFDTIGSWPTGPDGEFGSLLKCACGAMKEVETPEEVPEPEEPPGTPCYRTKVHEPHQWLKGRKAVPCPGIPEEN